MNLKYHSQLWGPTFGLTCSFSVQGSWVTDVAESDWKILVEDILKLAKTVEVAGETPPYI